MKKKTKEPKITKVRRRPFKRAQKAEDKLKAAISNVPRITNETLTEHREEVLSSARKYIYPLQHSRHNIVRISVALLITALIAFFAYCGLALYKLQSTSAFIYDVTKVVPFPVAKTGSSWISYESYLFELRRNMHYYRTQQQADFGSKSGKEQLERLRSQAMDRVVKDAYIKKLADENDVSVSSRAVNNQVDLVRNQNRLGSNDRVFKDVLKEFWGWAPDDFKRELKQELLQQAVVAKLDTKTQTRANAAFAELKNGAKFEDVATRSTDDIATKTSGGLIANPITPNDRSLAPVLTDEIFKLKVNETSKIINTGYSLEIIKITEISGKNRRVAHIQFNLEDISKYTNPLEKKYPQKKYIKIEKQPAAPKQ